MCVVTQRPKDVDSALLSQINTRIIHRLKTTDDINRVIVGDIEEFKSSVPRLSVGEAMIDSVEWVTPLYIQAAPSKSKKIDVTYEKG
jgi:DNA helicase HerA-like ATPase